MKSIFDYSIRTKMVQRGIFAFIKKNEKFKTLKWELGSWIRVLKNGSLASHCRYYCQIVCSSFLR
jgi:hypothetical protein